jgi:hypothetical protein
MRICTGMLRPGKLLPLSRLVSGSRGLLHYDIELSGAIFMVTSLRIGRASKPMLCCALSVLLAACGTTSALQTSEDKQNIDLTPYTRLLIENFTDEATHKAKPELQPVLRPKLADAVRLFPDQIASVVQASGGFEEVLREGPAGAETLVLRGAITQFDEGNAALRWMVGFGAGNVNFDARLELVDGGSDKVLGTWLVDKNSWALGGGLAATQNPQEFMAEAAGKIGREISEKRKIGYARKPG